MAFYRETESGISREYKVLAVLDSHHTGKSHLDIVRTDAFGDVLFLDNELQLATRDEYIYHESLVHPVMSCIQNKNPQKVCILGGGDGCAAREVLKWQGVEQIDIIDWDREIIHLFSHQYASWNKHSLQSPKVKIFCENILTFLPECKYDVVIVDLLDPNYQEKTSSILWPSVVEKLLSIIKENGSIVINVGGITPWSTENAEWINMLLSNQFRKNTTHSIQAYKVFVPSFQTEWCFFMISPSESLVNTSIFDHSSFVRYFDTNAWRAATSWSKDYGMNLPINKIKLSESLPPV